MTKIINMYGILNQDTENIELKKLTSIFDKYMLEEKEYILESTNPENYVFLISNYTLLNNSFSNLSKDENVTKFINLVFEMLSDFPNADQKVYAILFSYNLYRIYGNKLIDLTAKDISILISLYMTFEQSYPVKNLDKMSDFIFNKELKNEMYSYDIEKRKLVHLLEVAIDDYFYVGIKNKIPVTYFVKKQVSDYRKSLITVVKKLKLNTPEEIYDYMYNEVSILAGLLISTQEYENVVKGEKLNSSLNSMVLKMRQMKPEDLETCTEFINNMINKSNLGLLDKTEKIFKFIDVLAPEKMYSRNKKINIYSFIHM